MDSGTQQKLITINRGLFLVRYAGAEDQRRPPIIKLAVNVASKKNIEFILHPDHEEATLWQPGTCLAVRATTTTELSVEVVPAADGGLAGATVQIEPLTQGLASGVAKLLPKRHSRAPFDLTGLHILGHVTGIGDRRVNANDWIAGPSAPSRIEGISIEWPDKPPDLNIHYAVKTAKSHAMSGRAVSLGSFAGTRGEAMPIIGLMLEISGPAADGLQFAIDAIFLGAPTMHMTGRRIICSGPTGREPLVGLRLALEYVQKSEPTRSLLSPVLAEKAAAGPAKRSAIRSKASATDGVPERSRPTRTLSNRAKPPQPALA